MTRLALTGAVVAHVGLRDVTEADLPVLFEHQRDPDAVRMAAFVARDRAAFDAHWRKILGDPAVTAKAIVADGVLAGNIGAWGDASERLVGYWIGKEHWGQGIASRALAAFLAVERARPLFAHVAKANVGSLRVLQKCGFVGGGAHDGAATDGVAELILRHDEAPPP
jgi:RimJ/RimL family protein N-acetyltransferase